MSTEVVCWSCDGDCVRSRVVGTRVIGTISNGWRITAVTIGRLRAVALN